MNFHNAPSLVIALQLRLPMQLNFWYFLVLEPIFYLVKAVIWYWERMLVTPSLQNHTIPALGISAILFIL